MSICHIWQLKKEKLTFTSPESVTLTILAFFAGGSLAAAFFVGLAIWTKIEMKKKIDKN